jgi:hypothetical protein
MYTVFVTFLRDPPRFLFSRPCHTPFPCTCPCYYYGSPWNVPGTAARAGVAAAVGCTAAAGDTRFALGDAAAAATQNRHKAAVERTKSIKADSQVAAAEAGAVVAVIAVAVAVVAVAVEPGQARAWAWV